MSKVTQEDREGATAIRAALYRAAPGMPSYPDDIVPPIIAAHTEAAIKAEREAIGEWLFVEARKTAAYEGAIIEGLASAVMRGHHLTKAGEE